MDILVYLGMICIGFLLIVSSALGMIMIPINNLTNKKAILFMLIIIIGFVLVLFGTILVELQLCEGI